MPKRSSEFKAGTLKDIPAEEAGYNKAIKDIKSKLNIGEDSKG